MTDLQIRDTVIQLLEGMKNLKEQHEQMKEVQEKRIEEVDGRLRVLERALWLLLGAVAVTNIPSLIAALTK